MSQLLERHGLERGLVDDLRRIVGKDAVITAADRLLSYESDGLTAYRERPAAAVLPADTDEARRVLATLHRAGAPTVPRGAGTGLSGGALAVAGGVVVGTARMNRILEIDPLNRRARVQSGTVNARLSEAARPHGLHYVPDPSSQSACTLGGNVAENSGGPHCLKYGVTSRYVTGLTLVLPDGEVAELDGYEVAGAGGFDLVGVIVGSEGCFGLVTEIEVELLPLPEGVRTLLAVFEEIEDAGRAVTDIIGQGLLPAALEIVDRETIRAVESSVYAAGYPVDAGAALVVEFDGVDAGLDDDAARAEDSCRRAGAREVRRARDEGERAALWKGRKKAFGAMGRVAPDLMVQDATVPRTRLPEVLRRIGEIARRYDLTVANVFHAGDGNLHPNILFDRRNADELQRVERASREMMEACVEVGGTITGEHGVGVDKRGYMPLVHGPRELSAMADVKAVFDPGGRFNVGKVLPDGVSTSRAGSGTDAQDRAPAIGSGDPRRSGVPRSSPEAVASRVEALVGGSRVSWDAVSGRPSVTPASTEEVAAVLEAAHAAGWTVWPAGAGLEPGPAESPELARLGVRERGRPVEGDGRPSSGGATGPPLRASRPTPDVVLRTTGLDGISLYEPADLTLTAGAGLSLTALAERTRAEGQWLPLDPPGQDSATLGGALAVGLGGSLAGMFGRPRDLVLGLTCVTGDGRVLRLGGRVVKNVAGFDLVKLLVGSRGRLGVITEGTVRLFPVPEADRLLEVRADAAEALVPAIRALATASLPPAAVELGEGLWGEVGARAVVRLLGSRPSVAEQERRLRARVPELEPVTPGHSAGLLRDLRGVDGGPGVGLRVAFPPARLEPLLRSVRELERAVGRDGNGSARLTIDGARGVLRWWLADGKAANPGPWRRLRESVAPEPPLVVRRLESGIAARFDPGSVLPGSTGFDTTESGRAS